MTDKTTCGVKYRDGLEAFTGLDPNKIPIFAAGFITGQAEKVYLGACLAAMFRPSAALRDTVEDIVDSVCVRYGLGWRVLAASRGREIWIYSGSTPAARMLDELALTGENSMRWHDLRGRLCGVPQAAIDHDFHHRAGYGEACDV